MTPQAQFAASQGILEAQMTHCVRIGRRRGTYPCCEAVQRVERVPGNATTLAGGVCPIHGATFAGLAVYAVGWWGEYAYHTGIVERDGERWGEMRYTSDRDVERLEV